MEIQNNKEEVPFSHYLALFEKLDPQEAVARCGVPFENGCFTLRLLNADTALHGRNTTSRRIGRTPSR